MNRIYKYSFVLVLLLLFVACSTTKYVPKEKYLLQKVKLQIDDKRVSKSEAEAYLKQKPNTRIFGLFPSYLRVYNFSGRDTTKKINQFLRKYGEAPVIYDSIKTQRTIIQLNRFMENKGFYGAEIDAVEKFKKQKVKLIYRIKANQPKIIHRIHLHKDSLIYKVIGRKNMAIELADSTDLRQLLIHDDQKIKIKKGSLFDIDQLKTERTRLENLYQSKGYYNFDKDNIHFYIDTTKLDHKVDIYYGLRAEDSLSLRKYKIRKIIVHLDMDATQNREDFKVDSLEYKGITFFYRNKMPYKPDVLAKAITLQKGQLYSPENVSETKERLAVLQQFKYSNLSFKEYQSLDSVGLLDCFVQLVSQKRQSYGVEATATLNSGALGFATNLRYRHKNLFKGAELFTVKLSTGVERVGGEGNLNKFSSKEFGGTVNIISPKFFLPFIKAQSWRAKSPRTSLSLVYNYSERPEYTRTITDLNFSYQWRSNNLFTHVLTPMDLGLLKVNADLKFLESLNNYYRQTSYVDHIIASLRYSLRFNNKGKTHKTTYQRARFNVETAGNLLNAVDHFFTRTEKKKDTTGKEYYSYFGIRYAQYIRSDVEFTYNQFMNPDHAMVYHLFVGAGFPYGNSNVMPFEKMYFSGGPNSMRAWQPRSLGPGESKLSPPAEHISYGELKLEANIEYRFSLTNKLEGAVFVDAGNVWNMSSLAERDKDSKFKWQEFYKQIAVGAGAGLRYNISNIILRLDAGTKIIDPFLERGHRFVPSNKRFKLKDITLNFGIGYPF